MQAVNEAQTFLWPPLLSRTLHTLIADEHSAGAAASTHLLEAHRHVIGGQCLPR